MGVWFSTAVTWKASLWLGASSSFACLGGMRHISCLEEGLAGLTFGCEEEI